MPEGGTAAHEHACKLCVAYGWHLGPHECECGAECRLGSQAWYDRVAPNTQGVEQNNSTPRPTDTSKELERLLDEFRDATNLYYVIRREPKPDSDEMVKSNRRFNAAREALCEAYQKVLAERDALEERRAFLDGAVQQLAEQFRAEVATLREDAERWRAMRPRYVALDFAYGDPVFQQGVAVFELPLGRFGSDPDTIADAARRIASHSPHTEKPE